MTESVVARTSFRQQSLPGSRDRTNGHDRYRCGHHAHPEKKGAGFLSDLGEADRVDARLLDGSGIRVLVNLST